MQNEARNIVEQTVNKMIGKGYPVIQEQRAMKTPTDWAIIDHGVENSQYFQGCGVCGTRFEHVVTGCGENAKEAFKDALGLVADYADTAQIAESERGIKYLSDAAKDASVESWLRKNDFMEKDEEGDEVIPEDCELYYYVSIRWNDDSKDE